MAASNTRSLKTLVNQKTHCSDHGIYRDHWTDFVSKRCGQCFRDGASTEPLDCTTSVP